MCGITGLFQRSPGTVSPDLLNRMNQALVHRGPDGEGLWISKNKQVGLAMRRLAIIDRGGGQQPIFNEDGTIGVVFNGEIYNFQELRTELEAKGHRFKTHSDTETIVHLYEDMGVDCVQKLSGMFAFSLWDEKKERLFLARDRFGKKPLFYVNHGGRLAWASELQALKTLDWPRDLNPEALDLYLSLQYIPSPHTIYKAVKKLPPAHRLVVEKGSVTVERYWDLPLNEKPLAIGWDDAQTEIRRLLTKAVKRRMISEVPLGAFLSGGMDSSVIVGLMSELSDKPVKTFSIGFDHERFSEVGYARRVADHFRTEHHEFIVHADGADALPLLVKHYGEPFADASALPTYYVARETRRHVTVALNGDGGDENFAGYYRYQALAMASLLDRTPLGFVKALAKGVSCLPEGLGSKGVGWRLKRLLDGALKRDPASRHLEFARFFSQSEKKSLYSPAFRASLIGDGALGYLRAILDRGARLDTVNRSLYTDFSSYLPECLMTKVDIATMAVSLEGRSPLLDHEFVEFVFQLPGSWKLRGLMDGKHIFKETFKNFVPASVVQRKKMGFGIPLGPWFRGHLKDMFQDTVLSPEALARGYFQPETIKNLWAQHQSGQRDNGYRLWALLILELWFNDKG